MVTVNSQEWFENLGVRTVPTARVPLDAPMNAIKQTVQKEKIQDYYSKRVHITFAIVLQEK